MHLNQPPTTDVKPISRWALFALLAGLLLLALIPYGRAGFFCDDAINSTFPGTMQLTGHSLWEEVLVNNRSWMAHGRFYPLAQVGTFLNWAYLSSLPYERAGQIALILLNIALFARFLIRLTGSRSVALIFVAALPAFFQARTFADPMLDFSPLMQQELLFLVLSLDYFWAALDGDRSWLKMTLSLASFVCAMLTYEVGLSTVVVIAMLAIFGWKMNRRITCLGICGYALSALAYVAYNLHLKKQVGDALYPGVALSINGLALHAYGIQLGATIPFTYYFADPHSFLRHAPWPGLDTLAIAAAIVILTVLVIWEAGKHLQPLRYRGLPAVSACAVLACVPAAFVAISARYQAELVWGLAYLPIYLQFFGFAAVIVVLICQFLSRLQGRPVIIVLALGLLIGVGNAGAFLANTLMVEHENTFWLYPRIVDEQAVHEGLLDQVPEGSTLVRDGWRAWDLPAFYMQHAHRRFDVTTLDKVLATAPDTEFGRVDLSGHHYYEIRSDAVLWPHGGGWAMVARLQSVDYRKVGSTINVLDHRWQDPEIFKLSAGIPSTQQIDLAETGLVNLRGVAGVPWRVDNMAIPVRGTRKWSMYRLPEGIYHAGPTRPGASNLYPTTVRRPFLVATDTSNPSTPAGKLELSALDATNLPSALVGVGYGCELTEEGVVFGSETFSRMTLNGPDQARGFGLAFRVRPGMTQVPHADVASNHRNNMRGFALERANDGPADLYEFVIGDGGAWHLVGTIRLPANQWSMVVFNFEPTGSSVRVMTDTAEQHCADVVTPASVGDNIIQIGNWIEGARPFQGVVKDFTLLARPFSAEESNRLLDQAPPASLSLSKP